MSTNQQSDKIDFILFLNSRKQIAIYVPSYVNLFTNNIYFNKIKNSQVRVVLDVAFRTQWAQWQCPSAEGPSIDIRSGVEEANFF